MYGRNVVSNIIFMRKHFDCELRMTDTFQKFVDSSVNFTFDSVSVFGV